jgi:hypothetical protein
MTGPHPDRVPAVGGTRTVPVPDAIAADYIRLGLHLDQHIPGLVDGYFGPADLKAEVDMAQRRDPLRLRDDAAALRARLPTEVADPSRRRWLDAQLVALEAQAAAVGGDPLPYETHVERCMGFAPPRRPDASFTTARAAIDELLPGDAPLSDRLAAWDAALEIPGERLPGVIDWLVARFRERADSLFGLPDGEDLRVRLVTGQPWSGYNWYDGGRRSRVAVNTDLPVRVPDLVHTVAHETYPGHHLEHAWKEADLVDGRGHLEASILLINPPECPISEGLADVGTRFAAPAEEIVPLFEALLELAELGETGDAPWRRATAERAAALQVPRRAMQAIRGNAAFLRHADGRTHAEVLDYLRDVGGYTTTLAEKRLEFIEHPLWRTYVFVYAEGEALLERWMEAGGAGQATARFDRLLHEQLTPAGILAELD